MKNRILIVDDARLNIEILRRLLKDEYELAEATNGEEALQQLMTFGPDIVLLDIVMPGIDGYETCRRIKQIPYGELTQVILVSSKGSTKERLQGYEAGADDYVVKPFNHDELLAKVRIQFRLRGALTELTRLKAEVEIQNTKLDRRVRERTAEIEETRNVTVFALAKLAEARDSDTGEHLERMRTYSMILAEHLSQQGPYTKSIDEGFLKDLYLAAPLHDIGKVGISDEILLKPGRLTDREFKIMERHTLIGAETLDAAIRHTRAGDFLTMAADIARSHHERFNGSGYPHGLKALDIPLAARLVSVADVFDALTSARVYKDAMDPQTARRIIEDEADEQFDPTVVVAFRATYDDFLIALCASGHGHEPKPVELVTADAR